MTVQGLGPKPVTSTEDRTMDSFAPIGNALGTLIVLQSDDPSMLNQRIELSHPVTRLGRKADNEIIFAMDSPVSRHHAVIEARDGQMFLSEIVVKDEQTGQPKRPAYGTFVNGLQIQEPVRLQDGDEIALGKRLRMRFEAVQIPQAGSDRTMDQMEAVPTADEKTLIANPGIEPGVPEDAEKTVIATSAEQVDLSGATEKTVIAGSTEQANLSDAAEKTLIAGSAEETVISSRPDNSQSPGENEKTLIARADDEPQVPSQADKTSTPGGSHA